MQEKTYARDCRHFRGDRPCEFMKSEGAECICTHYDPIKARILIIKLGELGDVIRTTPILNPLKKKYPSSAIYWLTKSPEFLPKTVDYKMLFNQNNLEILKALTFDVAYNFDKDLESCAVMSQIKAKVKKGFELKDGQASPIDKDAQYKYAIGLDDALNLKNAKGYVEQTFEIAGMPFQREEYFINQSFSKGKALIGLNTGCGSRWPTREWPEQHWEALASRLLTAGYGVLLLGGPDEHAKNQRISQATGALYLGHHPLTTFAALIGMCDLVVTTVTMALHIAIALKKKIICFNNVFNKAEFDLYGLGEIIEPPRACVGCWKSHCEWKCMEFIHPSIVEEKIAEVLQ